jgi:hypothetical protein
MKLWHKWKKTSVANQLMVYTTAIVAFGTIFYAAVAVFQWQLMKESAVQTAGQVDKLIDQAKRLADTSKTALDATVENFRLEQRAWVGPILVLPPEYTEGNKRLYVKEAQPIKCGIEITNSGKTPAKNVQYSIIVQALKPPKVPILKESTGRRDITVLQPNMTLKISYPPITGVTKSDIAALSRGQDVLYMYGIIRYDDVFKKTHWTTFCVYLAPDLATFSSCPYYNDTDDK